MNQFCRIFPIVHFLCLFITSCKNNKNDKLDTDQDTEKIDQKYSKEINNMVAGNGPSKKSTSSPTEKTSLDTESKSSIKNKHKSKYLNKKRSGKPNSLLIGDLERTEDTNNELSKNSKHKILRPSISLNPNINDSSLTKHNTIIETTTPNQEALQNTTQTSDYLQENSVDKIFPLESTIYEYGKIDTVSQKNLSQQQGLQTQINKTDKKFKTIISSNEDSEIITHKNINRKESSKNKKTITITNIKKRNHSPSRSIEENNRLEKILEESSDTEMETFEDSEEESDEKIEEIQINDNILENSPIIKIEENNIKDSNSTDFASNENFEYDNTTADINITNTNDLTDDSSYKGPGEPTIFCNEKPSLIQEKSLSQKESLQIPNNQQDLSSKKNNVGDPSNPTTNANNEIINNIDSESEELEDIDQDKFSSLDNPNKTYKSHNISLNKTSDNTHKATMPTKSTDSSSLFKQMVGKPIIKEITTEIKTTEDGKKVKIVTVKKTIRFKKEKKKKKSDSSTSNTNTIQASNNKSTRDSIKITKKSNKTNLADKFREFQSRIQDNFKNKFSNVEYIDDEIR